jgi:succinate dehydrogenase/fumarate reductase flavoprotein subunit
VIKILTDKGRAFGLLCLEAGKDMRVYFSKNIIFATGGPSGLYATTVYPVSQFGSSGVLAREGVVFSNITEWQYGIGSIKFRWNLSGSYQQVIPRYLSIGENGNEEEFLPTYFRSIKNVCRAIFHKGYQWPFDPAKIANDGSSEGVSGGSSFVDLAVYIERHIRGRRVFIDYTHNPAGFALEELDETARDYLEKSNALCPSPLERLLRLNTPAYDLYKSNGIDLAKEYLEIDVLPQHHSGGAEVNIWWETSVKHLFAIGECAGTHGVHRPGGSALNSGQVGGFRAASFIAGRYLKEEADDSFYGIAALEGMAAGLLGEFEQSLALEPGSSDGKGGAETAAELLRRLQNINTRTALFIRSLPEIEKSLEELNSLALKKPNPSDDMPAFFRFRETLLLSRLLYDGILTYLKDGGKSRGSYLVLGSMEDIIASHGKVEIDALHRDKVLNTAYVPEEGNVVSAFRQVRPIPASDTWFEKVWREYREGEVYNMVSEVY